MKPTLREEYELHASGYDRVAGIDEAGRGAWAGPVCAAAVVLPLNLPSLARLLDGVRDSKLLSPTRRDALLPAIRGVAVAVGLGWASSATVDELGIAAATRQAMAQAVAGLSGCVDVLLIDYIRLPDIDLPQRALPKADSLCLSVASASIVAKVERDRLMNSMEREFPGYGFARNKGYGTAQHREALARCGATALHRMTWRPLREWSGGQFSQ